MCNFPFALDRIPSFEFDLFPFPLFLLELLVVHLQDLLMVDPAIRLTLHDLQIRSLFLLLPALAHGVDGLETGD